MIYTKLTKTAMKIAFEAHSGQTDKNGIPYVNHPLHLAEQMTDEVSTAAALLHDVVEDTEWSFDDLRKSGICDEVIEAVRYLTHTDGVDYMDYVKNIANNEIAVKVKLADLAHNSDLSRLDEVTEKDLRRLEKYRAARALLEK